MLNKLCEYMPLHWVNYNINISMKHKYVYFETPKVACSSIKRTLTHAELGDELFSRFGKAVHTPFFQTAFVKPYHLTNQQLEEILLGDDYFKFTFSRNPYTRSLSCYLEKMQQQRSGYEQIEPFLTATEKVEGVTYKRYLEIVSSFTPYDMNSHFRPQYHQTFGDEVDFDFVGKFENFDQDFSRVLRHIGIEFRYKEDFMPHRTNADEKVAQYRSAETDQLVQTLYADDFKKFGYNI